MLGTVGDRINNKSTHSSEKEKIWGAEDQTQRVYILGHSMGTKIAIIERKSEREQKRYTIQQKHLVSARRNINWHRMRFIRVRTNPSSHYKGRRANLMAGEYDRVCSPRPSSRWPWPSTMWLTYDCPHAWNAIVCKSTHQLMHLLVDTKCFNSAQFAMTRGKTSCFVLGTDPVSTSNPWSCLQFLKCLCVRTTLVGVSSGKGLYQDAWSILWAWLREW